MWEDIYCDALPDLIRPRRYDDRFLAAAADAERNGWAPRQAAAVVQARNYANTLNPSLLAIMRLEDYAARPPKTMTQLARVNASGCRVCPPGRTCPDPVPDDRNALPWTLVVERMQLIRELMATPDMSEDDREHCMSVLITDQAGR